MRILMTAAAVVSICATSAFGGDGDILGGKAAKKMLFSHKGSEFVIVPQAFMSDSDVAVLEAMSGLKEFKSVLYYGAIAASPKDGLIHKATVASPSHHTLEAADRAAIKICNGLRTGGPKCVVVAHIVPKKYAPQAFSLSANATVALKKTYLRGDGPKAMAISPSKGGYGIGKGEGAAKAALAVCAADGARDCRIVVQD